MTSKTKRILLIAATLPIYIAFRVYNYFDYKKFKRDQAWRKKVYEIQAQLNQEHGTNIQPYF